MKRVIKIFIILFSILMISSLTFAREPQEDEVIFFEHKDYGGCWMGAKAGSDYASIAGNTYNPICGKTINWNDTISSIKVGSKVFVEVYEHVNYGGASKIFTSNNSNLHSIGWGDKISSFKVKYKSEIREPKEDEVIFFEHINYGGAWMGAKAGSDYASIAGTATTATGQTINWNDAISSLKVGSKVFVKVYEHVNYGGASKIFTSNNSNLHSIGWGDKISSFKIRFKSESCDPDTRDAKEDEVIFFEHINYGGCWMGAKIGSNYASLEGNAYNPICGKTINWNDTISSIKVGSKALLRVYEHVNYGGQSFTFQASCNVPLCLNDLRNNGWNDRISSFKIMRNPNCP